MNWVPLTVSAVAELPTVALDGESEARVGVGFGGVSMVKLSALDAPPPGVGFWMVIEDVPAEVRSDAGIWAVTEVLDTYVVAIAAPFHWRTEVETKPVPEAVTLSAELPATAEFGVNPLKIGVGFGGCEEPPPPQPRMKEKPIDKRQSNFQRIDPIFTPEC